uniref:Uncharacterized protein n=1 Tax=Anguilla anguilla TaxID=7936 RepID=A0A0E9PWV6_ANGAN
MSTHKLSQLYQEIFIGDYATVHQTTKPTILTAMQSRVPSFSTTT